MFILNIKLHPIPNKLFNILLYLSTVVFYWDNLVLTTKVNNDVLLSYQSPKIQYHIKYILPCVPCQQFFVLVY